MKIGLGQLGLGVEEFLDSEPREFFNRFDGFMELEKWRQREAWERMRSQTAALLNIHTKKRIRPRDVFRFEWDAPIVQRFKRDKALAMMKKLGIKGKLLDG